VSDRGRGRGKRERERERERESRRHKQELPVKEYLQAAFHCLIKV